MSHYTALFLVWRTFTFMICAFLVSQYCGSQSLLAQIPTGVFPTQATVHLPIEIHLYSEKKYGHPIRDVRILATFTHRQTGRTITQNGYWNGDTTFNGTSRAGFYVRFAPSLEGEWQCNIACSDTSNRDLHRRTGTFIANRQATTNSLVQHGFVRLSANRRTLEHSDGTPFFWLGDTAWNMPEASVRDEVIRFLDDRARKGFNVVQITFASAAAFTTYGNKNRMGETLYLRDDRSLYNPRWFDYADSIITWANARGIVVAILPQFATGVIEDYDRGWVPGKLLTREEARIGVTYLAARYAGHNVVWITGGDVQYNTPDIRAYWRQYGNELRAANGTQQLVSIHPEGATASYDFFENTESWLDFHMLQSSHQPWSDWRTQLIRRGYTKSPPKPILNAEPPYEDIELNFFLTDLQASFVGGKYLATDYDVRLAAYMSVFAGGLVGITYGANGIFQWNSITRPDKLFNPRYNTDQALSLPGSSQYGFMKAILVSLAWHEMLPRMDLLNSTDWEQGSAAFTGLIASHNALCLYTGRGLRSCSISCGSLRGEGGLLLKWISPETGMVAASSTIPFTVQPLQLQSPSSTQDWLLTVQRVNGFIPRTDVDSTKLVLTRFLTNKTLGSVELAFSVPDAGTLDIDVCDTRGASILHQTLQAARGEAFFQLPISARGAYFYRVYFRNERLQDILTGKFVQ